MAKSRTKDIFEAALKGASIKFKGGVYLTSDDSDDELTKMPIDFFNFQSVASFLFRILHQSRNNQLSVRVRLSGASGPETCISSMPGDH